MPAHLKKNLQLCCQLVFWLNPISLSTRQHGRVSICIDFDWVPQSETNTQRNLIVRWAGLSTFNSGKVEMRELSPSDYQLGPSFTKEFSLLGKDNKAEKLRVMQKPSLFNKHLKVVWVKFQRSIPTFCPCVKVFRCQIVVSQDARMSHWQQTRKNGYFSNTMYWVLGIRYRVSDDGYFSI